MSCLFCVHYTTTEPAEHRQAREAGQCPDHCTSGQEWDFGQAMRYVALNNKMLVGVCRLNAEPVQKTCADVCGHIELVEASYRTPRNYDRHVRSRKPGENLVAWAQRQMRLLVHGDYWERNRKDAENQNERLKGQLKAVRKISAGRLAQIRKLKPAKQTPAPPHLVPMAEAAD